MDIKVQKEMEHYIILINGRFYCSCDNMREVDEEIARRENANESKKNNTL